jgi:hypothetical protein
MNGETPDERPWMTKSQLAVALGRSSRTIDLYVRAGRVERMQDGSRAFFRLATDGNRATTLRTPAEQPEMAQLLLEIRDELRALRADNEALRAALGALPSAQLPAAEPEPGRVTQELPRNARRRGRFWRRFLYGPE